MKNKFPDMDNYTTIVRINPYVYGSISITATTAKNNSTKLYRFRRNMKYKASFSSLRDHMFAGLLAAYNKTFDMLEDRQTNTGPLKNYYMVAIETNNDIFKRILSFDMYMLQADNLKQLVNMPEFKNLPNVNDHTKCVAIFAYGYQYEANMNLLNICNKVFHTKAFKQLNTVIKMYDFKDNSDISNFDTDNEKCQQFLDYIFNRTDRFTYDVGLSLDDYTHDHIDHATSENNNTNATIESSVAQNITSKNIMFLGDDEMRTETAEYKATQNLEPVDVEEVLGENSMDPKDLETKDSQKD